MSLQPAMETDRTPRRRYRPHMKWLLAGASLVCACGAVELWVRMLDLGPAVYAPRRFEPGGAVPFATIDAGGRSLLVYRAQSTFSSVYDPAGDSRRYFGPEGRVVYRINALGLRGGPIAIEKDAGGYRVICLGDSITFGEGVREEDTFVARLQGELSAAMPGRAVEVINAGVQGYGTREEELMFDRLCVPLAPNAVVLQFFLNDATDFGETIRQNDDRTHALELSLPARASRVWEIIERSRHAARLQREYFATTRRSFDSLQWDACRKSLANMAAESKQRNFRFVVIVFPILWGLNGEYPFENLHAKIADACRQAGCAHIDLLEDYRGKAPESLWVHPTDHHPNEAAHEIAARRISAYLLGGRDPA